MYNIQDYEIVSIIIKMMIMMFMNNITTMAVFNLKSDLNQSKIFVGHSSGKGMSQYCGNYNVYQIRQARNYPQ